jgi:hypothetical protein
MGDSMVAMVSSTTPNFTCFTTVRLTVLQQRSSNALDVCYRDCEKGRRGQLTGSAPAENTSPLPRQVVKIDLSSFLALLVLPSQTDQLSSGWLKTHILPLTMVRQDQRFLLQRIHILLQQVGKIVRFPRRRRWRRRLYECGRGFGATCDQVKKGRPLPARLTACRHYVKGSKQF